MRPNSRSLSSARRNRFGYAHTAVVRLAVPLAQWRRSSRMPECGASLPRPPPGRQIDHDLFAGASRMAGRCGPSAPRRSPAQRGRGCRRRGARVHCVSVHPFVRMHRLKLSCWAMAANWFLRSCVDSASPSHSNMSRSRWAVVAFGIVHRAGPQADKSSSPTQSTLALRGHLTSEFACALSEREAAGLRR